MQEKELPASPITLPKSVNYEDLDKAHEDDVKVGVPNNASGANENAIYPKAQAEADSLRTFREQAINADTPDSVSKLKKSLSILKKSDLDAKMAQTIENRAKRVEKVYKDEKGKDEKIGNLDVVELRNQQVASNEPLEVDGEGNATISEFDLKTGNNQETRVIIEKIIEKRERIFAIQHEKSDKYISLMGLADDVKELKTYLKQMQESFGIEAIGLPHVQKISEAYDDRLAVLQNEKAEELGELFEKHDSIEDAGKDAKIISDAVENDSLDTEQTPALLEIIQNTLEKNAIRDIQKIKDKEELEAYIVEKLTIPLGEGYLRRDQIYAIQTAQENRILILNEDIDP